MFSPVHVPVGMLLAHALPGGPVTAFIAGVASHLILDAVPHGDAGIGHWVASAPNRKIRLQRILPVSLADQILTLCLFLVLIRSPFFVMTPSLNFWPEPPVQSYRTTSPASGICSLNHPVGWRNSTACTIAAIFGAVTPSTSSPVSCSKSASS